LLQSLLHWFKNYVNYLNRTAAPNASIPGLSCPANGPAGKGRRRWWRTRAMLKARGIADIGIAPMTFRFVPEAAIGRVVVRVMAT